ncbi:MAG: hypothetical protein WDA27_06240 [Actinomycetota bacterium]
MRYRWLMGAFALTGMLSFSPAVAGPYETSFVAANGVAVAGKMAGGGAVSVSLLRLEGVDASGMASAVPNPQPPDYQTYADLPATVSPGARYVGCISVTVDSRVDSGCSLLVPITLNISPGMSDASVSFSVKSQAPGRQIVANLLLTGGTAVGPSEDFVPAFDPASPRTFAAYGTATLSRDATIIGTVRSDEVGGGALGTVDAMMWQGLVGKLAVDTNEFVCRPKLPCDV